MSTPSNRLVLKVELIDSNRLRLTLVYLDKRFLTTDKSFKYFYNDIKRTDEIFFFSKGEFGLLTNSVKFPCLDKYNRGVIAERVFNNTEERYEYLKKLHQSLNNWNNNYPPFKKSEDHINRREKIKFNGEFWIL